ncbi:hypothetical protein TNCV_2197961 [Trichonephila clavipes]|nr:hypothetical protein TNCV_2197961 [Trichonephila clavipes]
MIFPKTKTHNRLSLRRATAISSKRDSNLRSLYPSGGLEDCYNKWKISINPTKTEAVFFLRRTQHKEAAANPHPKSPGSMVQNRKIPWSHPRRTLKL